MGKPNQPKDIKPKTEGEEKPKVKAPIDDNMKVIVINLITTILICVLFISVSYVLQSNLLDSKLSTMSTTQENPDEATGEDTDEAVQHGVIVDLGDFILNLSDVSPRKYLKVNVALEVSNKPEDLAAAAPSGGHGGGHGGGESAATSPIEAEMAQFKPAIRDAVITTLSSKSSSELASVAGKELAKEQISESVNSIFAGEREVIRVSFGQFIIQ